MLKVDYYLIYPVNVEFFMKKMCILIAIAVAAASFTTQSLARIDVILHNKSGYFLQWSDKKITHPDDFLDAHFDGNDSYQTIIIDDPEPYLFIRPVTLKSMYEDTPQPINDTFYNISHVLQQSKQEKSKHENEAAIITITPDFNASLTWEPLE
jgi:hypothetical protein